MLDNVIDLGIIENMETLNTLKLAPPGAGYPVNQSRKRCVSMPSGALSFFGGVKCEN